VVVEQPPADGQVEAGRQGPRTGRLHLERAGVADGGLGQHVKVAFEQVTGAAEVQSGMGGDPPGAGVELDRQLGQEPGPAADHVRPRAAGRQFGQVRQVDQLTQHELGGLDDVVAGQRPDPGRRAGGPRPRRHGADPVMVAEPSTTSPSRSGR
jgi:hypothetical protein